MSVMSLMSVQKTFALRTDVLGIPVSRAIKPKGVAFFLDIYTQEKNAGNS